MRIDGTLTKWNDDRGFGFITPTQGGPEVFAHISAFPRDGQRPRIGERLTFEIGIGKDGKQQAKNIVCPTRPAENPYRLSEPAKRSHKPGLLGRLISLAFIVALGAYGYNEYTHRATPQTAYEAPSNEATAPSSLRRSNPLLANDILRRGGVFPEKLPERQDGWKQRWRAVRTTVVQLTIVIK